MFGKIIVPILNVPLFGATDSIKYFYDNQSS